MADIIAHQMYKELERIDTATLPHPRILAALDQIARHPVIVGDLYVNMS